MPQVDTPHIRHALQNTSPAIVGEIYEIAQRQLQAEASRQTILDGKATTLLMSVGLSLTLALTLGCQILLGSPSALVMKAPWIWRGVLLVLLYLGTICAIAASALAVLSLRVSQKYRAMNAQTIFNRRIIDMADAYEQKGGMEPGALAVYRRHLIPQMWEIVRDDGAIHTRKARLVRWGQWCFLGFIVAVGLTALTIAMVAALTDPVSQSSPPGQVPARQAALAEKAPGTA
jgi:hypothetical protein